MDNNVSGSASLVTISPPPENIYPCHNEAEAALYAWTKTHGFSVSRHRVRCINGSSKVIWARNFECDRTGEPKCTQHLLDEDRKRPLRGSKRIGCTMRIAIRAVNKNAPGGEWQIVHTGNDSQLHNHAPSQDARVHAAHLQLAAQATEHSALQSIVGNQIASAIPATGIYASILNTDPGLSSPPKTSPTRRALLAVRLFPDRRRPRRYLTCCGSIDFSTGSLSIRRQTSFVICSGLV